MRRHLDQLRIRYPSELDQLKDQSVDDSWLPLPGHSDNDIAPAGSSELAAPAYPPSHSSSPSPPPVSAPSSPSATDVPARRSTRVRKPVQRYSPSVQT